MISCSMILLASATGYGFEVLDTSDSEWVAPGYEVIEEAVIDPLEYGEPYLSDGSPTVGVHLSFVESDFSEAWRVVFVLDRKVVVLQEGEDPVEIPVDLEIESCAFSPSGRYVVVHDGAEVYTGRNAARIDTWSGEAEIFDSQPDGQAGSRNILVSNSGSVLCGWTFFDQNLGLIGLGPEIPQVVAPVFSPSGAYCAAINMASLYIIDDEAELVWERNTVRNGTAATLGGPYHLFSPDERYIAVPLQTGLEVWDAATGETVWRDESGEQGSTPVFDLGGSTMWHRGAGYELPDDLASGQPAIVLEDHGGAYRLWRIIAASRDVVLLQPERRSPNLRRRALANVAGEIFWASEAWEILPAGHSLGETVNWSGRRYSLSPSGISLAAAGSDIIRVIAVRSVP